MYIYIYITDRIRRFSSLRGIIAQIIKSKQHPFILLRYKKKIKHFWCLESNYAVYRGLLFKRFRFDNWSYYIVLETCKYGSKNSALLSYEFASNSTAPYTTPLWQTSTPIVFVYFINFCEVTGNDVITAGLWFTYDAICYYVVGVPMKYAIPEKQTAPLTRMCSIS